MEAKIGLKIKLIHLHRHRRLDSININLEGIILTWAKTYPIKSSWRTYSSRTKTNMLIMHKCISNRRDHSSMERISSRCRARKKDLKLPAWYHLVINPNLINNWEYHIPNLRRLPMNSKTSMEYSSQAEIEEQEIT